MAERPDQPDQDVSTVVDEEQHPSVVEHEQHVSPEDQRVEELLAHSIDVPVLAEAVEQQEAADAADTLERLRNGDAAQLLEEMGDEPAAMALAEMEMPLARSVIEDLVEEEKAAYAGHLLELMDPDDAADLLQAFDEDKREELLAAIPKAQALNLRDLVEYPEESAGGMMTTDFVSLVDSMTVGDAIERIRRSGIPRSLQHLLVVDDSGVFIGVVNMRDLLLHQPDTPIADIMERDVDAVYVEVDREAVAHHFDRYDYYMLAVVDQAHRLLGVITVDDVIDIIRAEQTEDVQQIVGAGKEEAVYSGLRDKLRGRFPWLLVNLFTTGLAALVVLQFEGLIAKLAILAVLMPMIAAQAGNAGHQSLAVTLRGLVLNQVRGGRAWPLLLREATVGLLTGLVLGVLLGIALYLLGASGVVQDASWKLGVVTAIAMTISTSVGTLAGVGIPLLMKRVGADPAMASAIFLVMITDAVSFLTFLGSAWVVADWLGVV